jgi:ABC-type oligopeptide transport system substrate-binding subunit/class 3 adenylate cyclase
VRCPTCGETNPDQARFCHACGSSLSEVSADRLRTLRAFIPAEVAEKITRAGGLGERRIVTALFCDVVGSTTLGERLGPERFKVAMDQLLGRIIAAISRYEGTVAQVMGDGLLAFFGAPLAHEDDPERAVRASLDLRDAVAAYSHDLEAAYGLLLQVRVGLNSGPVVLSRVTDVLEIAYNALGDTVTTAARLQSAASPGTILATEATGRLVSSLFELRPVGPLILKGKSAPVPAVEILSRRAVVGKTRGIVGLTATLVGRDQELALLGECAHAVTEGRGQIVAIVGEAGIGKSRLVAEVQRANPQVRWLEGRCLSYAATIPYFPFQDLFREWLGVSAGDHEAKVRIELRTALDRAFGPRGEEVYPYFGTMLRLPLESGPTAQIADLSAESLQHQTFNVVREWAVHLAAQQPLALILDDLHWADATSLALLEALLEVTEQAPLLLGLLFRAERDHGCWRLNDFARQRFPHRHVEVALRSLTPAQTEELIGRLLAASDLSAQSRRIILDKAEGNPFYVEEVIRQLIDIGILVAVGDQWQATRQITQLDVPDSIQGVLFSRIDRLSGEARRVLQAAAVIGRLFPVEILRAILGQNGQLDAALVDLQRLDLVIERRRIPQAEYRFKHALTQEVAYSTLAEPERHRLHREVAGALEQHYVGRLEEAYALLAYHYDQAKEEERAVQFLVRAGDKARAEYADEEALRYYARAVDLMKQRGKWERAATTLMKMALAHHVAFDFSAANHTYQEAFQILRRLPTPAPVGLDTALRLAMAEPATVDMAHASDIWSSLLAHEVFEGLLRYAPDSNVGLGLAQAWEISEDGVRYVFYLRQNRAWSDGRPVTAADFVFSWRRAMRGTFAHIFHDIRGAKKYFEGTTEDADSVGVRALDDHTLEVELEGPRAYFPFILAHSAALPHPRWVIERFGEEWTAPDRLVVNGPYLLAQWERGSHGRLVANPRYRGPRRGNVSEIQLVFKHADDPALFQRGEADVQLLFTLDEEQVSHLRSVLHVEPPVDSMYLFFRCDQPPFDDRRLRLAFAHATDRQASARAGGLYAVPAAGGIVPPPIPGHSPGIGVPFDPERARRLLAEAGYPDGRGLGPFTMTIPAGVKLAALIPFQAWSDILGVRVTARTVPVQEHFYGLHANPTPIGFFGWLPDYPDPDTYLRLVFQSTSVNNVGRWRNARFDALVERAQAATDQRDRMALYHEADRLLVTEEAVIVPLGYHRTMWLVSPRIEGWWSSPVGAARIADLVTADTPAR